MSWFFIATRDSFRCVREGTQWCRKSGCDGSSSACPLPSSRGSQAPPKSSRSMNYPTTVKGVGPTAAEVRHRLSYLLRTEVVLLPVFFEIPSCGKHAMSRARATLASPCRAITAPARMPAMSFLHARPPGPKSYVTSSSWHCQSKRLHTLVNATQRF